VFVCLFDGQPLHFALTFLEKISLVYDLDDGALSDFPPLRVVLRDHLQLFKTNVKGEGGGNLTYKHRFNR